MSKKTQAKYRKLLKQHTIGDKSSLQRFRERCQYSQKQASEVTGISQQTISNWENIRKNNLPTIAQYFAYCESIAKAANYFPDMETAEIPMD